VAKRGTQAEFKPWLKIDTKDELLEKVQWWAYTSSESRINKSRKFSRSFIDRIAGPSFLLDAIRAYIHTGNIPNLMTRPREMWSSKYYWAATQCLLKWHFLVIVTKWRKLDQFLYYITQSFICKNIWLIVTCLKTLLHKLYNWLIILFKTKCSLIYIYIYSQLITIFQR